MRVLIALGGNAMTAPDGSSSPDDQRAAIAQACGHIAELLADGHEVIITHGNGPQVGNILRKNELAAAELPPVSLDWCGAQTQGTIGFTIVNRLEQELTTRGMHRQVAAVITRTRVDGDDPAFTDPVKPIGTYRDAAHAAQMGAHGQVWKDFGARGWRRVVPSPRPLEILETPTIATLVAAGWVVVAAGGGGIPVVADGPGWNGVEAVIDKDLSAARLAADLDVDRLVIATDVEHAIIGYGTEDEQPIGEITAAQMQRLADAGHFASGSMGPKVEAVVDFAASGRGVGIITALAAVPVAIAGRTGTRVTPAAASRTASS